jgi:hypothetical protein
MDKKIISEINRFQQIINYGNNLLLESLPGVNVLARVINRYATQNLDNIIRSSDESISRIFREISQATDEPTIFRKVKELSDLGNSVRGANDVAKAMRTAIRSANPEIDNALTQIVTSIETRIRNQGSSNIDINTILDTTIEGRFDGLTDDSRDLLKNMIYDESQTIRQLMDTIVTGSRISTDATLKYNEIKKATNELVARIKNPEQKSKYKVILDNFSNALWDTRPDMERALTNKTLVQNAMIDLQTTDEGEIIIQIRKLVNDVANSEAGRDAIRKIISDQGLIQAMHQYGYWKVFRNSIIGYVLIKGGALGLTIGIITLATTLGNKYLSESSFWMDQKIKDTEEGTISELSENNEDKIIQALIAINPSLRANQGGLKTQYTIVYSHNKKSLQVVDNNSGESILSFTLDQINNKLRQLNKS